MKLTLTPDPAVNRDLQERIERLSKPVVMLNPMTRSVQFLRGVYTRASFLSAGLHLLTGASSVGKGSAVVPGYPGLVLRHYLEHTSFASLSLDCRKAFDERPKGLTGGFFAKVSDDVLEAHAVYWSQRSEQSQEDAFAALRFLRSMFRLLARPRSELIKGECELEKRVGLVKLHADRAAAHLSLDDYAVHLLDLAHMVSALVLLGEIIRPFDDTVCPASRFNDLDAGALTAARSLFPEAALIPMFEHMDIATHARKCWKDPEWGLHYVTRQLPNATGWA